MNKRLFKAIIPILIMIEFISVFLTFKAYSNKEVINIKEENKVDKKNFSMFIETEDNDGNKSYEVYTGEDIFPSGYKLNTKRSSCVDTNGKVIDDILSYNNGMMTISSNKTAYCYLYFDIPIPIGEYLLDNPTNGLNTTLEGGLYRYQGTQGNVDNYICFGTSKAHCVDEPYSFLYRIIGIDEEGRLKLIKVYSEGISSWHDINVEVYWQNANIREQANYLYSNSDYIYTSDWINKIEDYNWKYANTIEIAGGANMVYHYETMEAVLGNINEKAGLLYVHDYYYSIQSGGVDCYNGDGNNSLCKQSWLHISNNDTFIDFDDELYEEWTMTSEYYWEEDYGYDPYGMYSYYIGLDGGVRSGIVLSEYRYRPVIYLKATELYYDGTGTINNPFTIS